MWTAPRDRQGAAVRCGWTTPGGTLATVVFVLASLAFSYHVTKFGSHETIYGVFAAVAILIFCLYLTGLAILVGAEINVEVERQTSGDCTEEPLIQWSRNKP